MNVVIKANVAGILAGHPEGLPIADIANQAGILSEKLGRILSFLATKHCFREGARHLTYICAGAETGRSQSGSLCE